MPQKITTRTRLKRRHRYEEKGLCSRCGQNLPKEDMKTCQNCLDYSKSVRQKYLHKRRQYARNYLQNLKRRIYAHYGNRCACPHCPESNPLFLSVDHINNDGYKQRKLLKSGKFYQWIVRNNFPMTLQLLCYNCNNGKRMNKGTCPHATG